MPIDLRSFLSWIQRIYATKEQELDCEAVFESIAPYVDTEIAGADPSERYPAVAHHLRQCSACMDLYLSLREAARAEVEEEAASLVSVRRIEHSQTGE